MDFLIAKLFWYILIAFSIGVCVGWASCGRAED